MNARSCNLPLLRLLLGFLVRPLSSIILFLLFSRGYTFNSIMIRTTTSRITQTRITQTRITLTRITQTRMSQQLASSFTALRSSSGSGAFSQQAEQISTTIQDDIDVKTFESVDRWYVFSDLHASSNTIKQTVRTLERLNELVMENEGMNGNKNGIIFLGGERADCSF